MNGMMPHSIALAAHDCFSRDSVLSQSLSRHPSSPFPSPVTPTSPSESGAKATSPLVKLCRFYFWAASKMLVDTTRCLQAPATLVLPPPPPRNESLQLAELGVTHVLNCSSETQVLPPAPPFVDSPPLNLPPQAPYGLTLHLPMRDAADESIIGHFERAFQFIEDCRAKGGRCLLHCQRGISRRFVIPRPPHPLRCFLPIFNPPRFPPCCDPSLPFSPSIAAAYLLWSGRTSGATLAQALAHVCERRCPACCADLPKFLATSRGFVIHLLQSVRSTELGLFDSAAAIRNAGACDPCRRLSFPSTNRCSLPPFFPAASWHLLNSHRRVRQMAQCVVNVKIKAGSLVAVCAAERRMWQSWPGEHVIAWHLRPKNTPNHRLCVCE
jgi:hypothetical protein